jgi:hypothetical protein
LREQDVGFITGDYVTAPRNRFKRTLTAVKHAGVTQGGIGDALRADIIDDIEQGSQVFNYFDDCEAFLREKGFEFDAKYLRQLYRASAITARVCLFR